MTEPDPYAYIPPTPETAPRYAAIRSAATRMRGIVEEAVQSFEPGVETAPGAAFEAVTAACRSLDAVVKATAPSSADRTAALRCLALARNAANEAVLAARSGRGSEAAELLRQVRDKLDDCRRQACTAIALAPSGTLPPMPELSPA